MTYLGCSILAERGNRCSLPNMPRYVRRGHEVGGCMLTWNEAYVRSLLPICSSTTPAFKPFRTSPFCSRHMRLAVASPAGPDILQYHRMHVDSCWAAKAQVGVSWVVVVIANRAGENWHPAYACDNTCYAFGVATTCAPGLTTRSRLSEAQLSASLNGLFHLHNLKHRQGLLGELIGRVSLEKYRHLMLVTCFTMV